MTFAAEIARRGTHKNLVLALAIDGSPYLFVEREVPATLAVSAVGATRTQLVCLQSLNEGETRLNLSTRLEEAATLSVSLLDDKDYALRSLFAVASRRVAYVDSDLTAATTTVTLDDTGSVTAGEAIYVDSEAIIVGTVLSSTILTGCTRGAYGTKATEHLSSNDTIDGASVYLVPPSWSGRKAQLYGFLLNASGGGEWTQLGGFVVDDSPTHDGDRTWSLSLGGVMQHFMARKIGVGLTQGVSEIDWTRIITTTSGVSTYTLIVDDAKAFRLGTSCKTYAILSRNDGEGVTQPSLILEVTDVDTATNEITVDMRVQFDSAPIVAANGPFTDIRPLVVYGAATHHAILALMISDEGQNVTSYDLFPGRHNEVDGDHFGQVTWRMGAGIDQDDVDVDAFEALTGIVPHAVIVDGEESLGDALTEWARLQDVMIVTNATGQISCTRLAARATPTTLGPDDVIPGTLVVEADESEIAALADVAVDYSPQTRDHRVTLNLADGEALARYPDNPQKIDLDMRMIGTDVNRSAGLRFDGEGSQRWMHPVSVSVGEVQSLAASIMRPEAEGPRRLARFTVSLAHVGLRLGDAVSLSGLADSHAQAPDMRGGTLDGATGRIVRRRPDYDAGTVELTIVLVDTLLHVAPSCGIASAAGAVLTLSTTGIEVASTTPQNDFYVGAFVFVVDASTLSGVSPIVETRTITAIQSAPPRLTLSFAPSFAIAAGDYVVLHPIATGTTATGYANTEIATTVGDGVGITGNERWG